MQFQICCPPKSNSTSLHLLRPHLQFNLSLCFLWNNLPRFCYCNHQFGGTLCFFQWFTGLRRHLSFSANAFFLSLFQSFSLNSFQLGSDMDHQIQTSLVKQQHLNWCQQPILNTWQLNLNLEHLQSHRTWHEFCAWVREHLDHHTPAWKCSNTLATA